MYRGLRGVSVRVWASVPQPRAAPSGSVHSFHLVHGFQLPVDATQLMP